jgi:hypothetical protein
LPIARLLREMQVPNGASGLSPYGSGFAN